MKARTPWLIVAVFLPLLAVSGAAQNLIVNGSFDYDASSWSNEGDPTVVLVHRTDAGSTLPGGSGPGCLEIKHYFWNGGADGAEQTVDITPGSVFDIKGAIFVPDSSDNVASNVSVLVMWYTAQGGSAGDQWVYPASFKKGEWLAVANTITAPGNAARARIRLMIANPVLPGETRPGIAYFDDLWLAPQGVLTSTQKLFVPVASSKAGANNTYWTTNMWVVNETAVEVRLAGAVLRTGQDNSAAVAAPTSLGTVTARDAVSLTDVVATLGANVTGALYLEAQADGGGLPATLIKVASRNSTPNPKGSGAYGQFVPVGGPGTMNRAVAPGAFQGSAYRTNAGILNTSAETMTVSVAIKRADGTEASSRTWTLQAFEPKLVSLPDLGASSLEGGFVVFTRTSSAGSFVAYISVVDQNTGDSILIVAH